MVSFRFKAATVSCIFIILSHNVSGYIKTVYTAFYAYVNKNLMIIDKSLLFSGIGGCPPPPLEYIGARIH